MIIDHVEQLVLGEDAANKRYFNELNSLRYLAQGLKFLSDEVGRIESAVRERIPKDKIVFGIGNVPWLKGAPMGLVACSFHWYAVAACNYVRLAGWMTLNEDESAARDYVKRVMPDTLKWRNKVAAHFSRTDRRNDDTAADLVSSVMFPVGWEDDTFITQPFIYSQTGSTAQPMRWSLTKTHSELMARYWPDGRNGGEPATPSV